MSGKTGLDLDSEVVGLILQPRPSLFIDDGEPSWPDDCQQQVAIGEPLLDGIDEVVAADQGRDVEEDVLAPELALQMVADPPRRPPRIVAPVRNEDARQKPSRARVG